MFQGHLQMRNPVMYLWPSMSPGDQCRTGLGKLLSLVSWGTQMGQILILWEGSQGYSSPITSLRGPDFLSEIGTDWNTAGRQEMESLSSAVFQGDWSSLPGGCKLDTGKDSGVVPLLCLASTNHCPTLLLLTGSVLGYHTLRLCYVFSSQLLFFWGR
jgi:hypothetical protein